MTGPRGLSAAWKGPRYESGKDITPRLYRVSIFGLDTPEEAWQNGDMFPFGAWRSLVARLPWAQEVPGSNPGAPTNIQRELR